MDRFRDVYDLSAPTFDAMSSQSNRSNRRQFATQLGVNAGVLAGVYAGMSNGHVFPKSEGASLVAANDTIGLGMISCGGRANELKRRFEKLDGVKIAAICDVDQKRVDRMHESTPNAATYTDMRDLLRDDNVDAVVVATCNHWHCLAAIWAMEAGKDVYVEKPLSHSQWEGDQAVAAARKYNRICQMGTQQRSDPMQAEIKAFLHDEQGIGDLLEVRVNRLGVRKPIGKRKTPLEIEKGVAYDLWLGPAMEEPIYRDKLQYDWHWDWNTGSGEMGNWGVHILDDVRNNVFRDSVILPKRIYGGGGRIAWDDAGETPNFHLALFDTGSIPVTIALSNLLEKPGAKRPPQGPGPSSGYVVYGSAGRLEGQRGRAKAFDASGKLIQEFKGNGSVRHQQNFIDAVRAQDRSLLNTDVEVGNASTGWCNLANIAFRYGADFNPAEPPRELGSMVDGGSVWQKTVVEMKEHLGNYGIGYDDDAIIGCPLLTVDQGTGKFVGNGSHQANQFLRRDYRSPYEVPQIQV